MTTRCPVHLPQENRGRNRRPDALTAGPMAAARMPSSPPDDCSPPSAVVRDNDAHLSPALPGPVSTQQESP